MRFPRITNTTPVSPITISERKVFEKRLIYIKTRYNNLLDDVFYFEEKGNKREFKLLRKCMEQKSEMMLLDIERQDIYTKLYNQTIAAAC